MSFIRTAMGVIHRINRLRTEYNLPFKEELGSVAIDEIEFEGLEAVLDDIRFACRVKEIVLK